MKEGVDVWRVQRVAGIVAALGLLAATYVSHLSQTAQLPPSMMDGGVLYWTSLRTLGGCPIEFLWAAWFLFALTLVKPAGHGIPRSLDLLVFWSGIAFGAVGAGLCYVTHVRTVPVAVATLVGLPFAASFPFRQSLAEPAARGAQVGLWGVIRRDWQVVRASGVITRLAMLMGLVLLAGQYLVLTARATTAADRDAQEVAWFRSQRG